MFICVFSLNCCLSVWYLKHYVGLIEENLVLLGEMASITPLVEQN